MLVYQPNSNIKCGFCNPDIRLLNVPVYYIRPSLLSYSPLLCWTFPKPDSSFAASSLWFLLVLTATLVPVGCLYSSNHFTLLDYKTLSCSLMNIGHILTYVYIHSMLSMKPQIGGYLVDTCRQDNSDGAACDVCHLLCIALWCSTPCWDCDKPQIILSLWLQHDALLAKSCISYGALFTLDSRRSWKITPVSSIQLVLVLMVHHWIRLP